MFRRELDALPASGLNLQVTSICEGDRAGQVWSGPRGRLSAGLLGALVPDLLEREIFLCGPGPYMTAAHNVLTELGVSPERVHQESFVIEPVVQPLTVVPDEPEAWSGGKVQELPVTATVDFRRSGRQV